MELNGENGRRPVKYRSRRTWIWLELFVDSFVIECAHMIEVVTKLRQRTLCQILMLIAACALHSSALAQYTQQGPKLVGTGALGPAQQGCSVALSADGNTALVGGCIDNANGTLFGDGAAWVWTRGGGLWTQQAKLADPALVRTL